MAFVEMRIYRPQSGYYKDIIEEAVALWEGFVMNYAFIDGNKRIAADLMLTFLSVNGVEVAAKSAVLTKFIFGLFDSGDVDFKHLDAWLREHTQAV